MTLCFNPSVGRPAGLLRRLLCGAKAPVVARFVPASVWKLAYTHNERRQSSLKATQCCGSALPPKSGEEYGGDELDYGVNTYPLLVMGIAMPNEEKRLMMSKAAYEKVKLFSVERIVVLWELQFEKIMRNEPAS